MYVYIYIYIYIYIIHHLIITAWRRCVATAPRRAPLGLTTKLLNTIINKETPKHEQMDITTNKHLNQTLIIQMDITTNTHIKQ